MEEFLQVGAIANTHGIAGEVKVFPMTDDIKRFKKLKEVYLDTGKERKSKPFGKRIRRRARRVSKIAGSNGIF